MKDSCMVLRKHKYSVTVVKSNRLHKLTSAKQFDETCVATDVLIPEMFYNNKGDITVTAK